MRASCVRATILGLALAACGGTMRDPSKPDENDAIVRVRTDVKDASLWVDGRFIGPIAGMRGGVAIEPGKHRFELRHDEYFSHYEELDLAPKQEVQLDIEMAPILP